MSAKVAIQVYSVRDEAQKDFAGTMKRLREFGYDGVELAGLYDMEPKRVGELIREAGLIPVSAHVRFAAMREDMEKVISDYTAVGVSHIAVPYLVEADRPGSEGFEKTIEDIGKFALRAKEAGLTMSYHNHDFEFVRIDGKWALDYMYEKLPAELLKAEFDTCWVHVAGVDPVEQLKKYAGRVPLVHIKDYCGKKNGTVYGLIGIERKTPDYTGDFDYRPVGYGVQDIKSVCEAAVESGCEWLIVEQDEPSKGTTRMDCAEKSREYLKKLGY